MGWEAKLAWPAEHEVGHSFSPSERDDRRRQEVTSLFLAERDDRRRWEAAQLARVAYSREHDDRRRWEVVPLSLAGRDDQQKRREATPRQGCGRGEPGAQAQPLQPTSSPEESSSEHDDQQKTAGSHASLPGGA